MIILSVNRDTTATTHDEYVKEEWRWYLVDYESTQKLELWFRLIYQKVISKKNGLLMISL